MVIFRPFGSSVIGVRRLALLLLATALVLPASARAARLLYTSDWSGTSQAYSVDPQHAGSTVQLTFGHARSCDPLVELLCGHSAVSASPDGRFIAYQSVGLPGCSGVGGFFVARADGRQQRRLGGRDCVQRFEWSPDSRRLLYVTGAPGAFVHDVRRDGTRPRDFGAGRAPSWSPAGHALAYLSGRLLYVVNSGRRTPVVSADAYAWSPGGKWLAVDATDGAGSSSHAAIVRPDGTGFRSVSDSYALGLTWSRDGRFIAFDGYDGMYLVNVQTASTQIIHAAYPNPFVWSHRSHTLAFVARDGISLLDAETRVVRRISSDHAALLAWAPDDSSLAYVVHTGYWPVNWTGDIRLVGATGGVKTVVHAAGDAGGTFSTLQWVVPKRPVRYRLVAPRVAAAVSGNEVTTPWPVQRIAAEGDHVAYTTCGHLFVWTPGAQRVVQAEPASLAPRCSTPHNYLPFEIYNVALAGDRIAFGARDGNMSQRWSLFAGPWSDPSQLQEVDDGFGYAGCSVAAAGLGDLVGDGDLLVFSRWREDPYPAPCGVATTQQVFRLDAGGCPCPTIASSPGPLATVDVDEGRVVAVGTNATVIFDRGGTQLLAVPVHAAAAQVDGRDLVVIVRGELRHYDAATGDLIHAWPLPDVPSGGGCGSPHPWACPQIRLELVDVSHELVAYVLDGAVHVMRLADGFDKTIGVGTTARFMNAGLVYASGAHLRLVSFAQLTAASGR